MAISSEKIEPIKRMNLTSQVMESVKTYIAENDLRSGARLPTEKELTLKLGVSRNILREALKSLEAVGLIQIRVGDGMYVSDFDYSVVVNHISFALARNGNDLRHFIEARLVTEVGAMELVVSRLTDEHVTRLRKCNTLIERAESIEDAAELDLEFHRELLSIADNPILSEFCEFLAQFFLQAQHLVDSEARFSTARGHRDLMSALASRRSDLAKQEMRKHILTWKTA